MKKKLRSLSILLALALTMSNVTAVSAYAATSNATGEVQNAVSTSAELTGLEICDLDEPAAGQKLDDRATVRSAEGVSWEIPVIWIDDLGRSATVAEEGRRYFPTLVFFTPDGYRIADSQQNSLFAVRLPGFITRLAGEMRPLYAVDPARGITYLTWDFTGTKPFYQGSSGDPTGSQGSETDAANTTDNDQPAPTPEPTPTPTPEPEPFSLAKAHCSQAVLEKYGVDDLEWLVSLIEHDIEPKAVAALLEGFPAYRNAAANNELGTQISLFVYDYDIEPKSDKSLDALAYVNGLYNANNEYVYLIGINIANLLEKKNGQYDFVEGKRIELENTLVHELMHGFMDDYTRTGMASEDWSYAGNPNPTSEYNAFPRWFMEGTATTVENAYRFYYRIFQQIMGTEREYTPEKIRSYFGIRENSLAYYRTDFDKSVTGSYVGGYLACIYLASGAASIGENYTTADIRRGLNTILEQLHNGTSLNDIIKGNTGYDGINDFEAKFLLDEESTGFCSNLLNYLEELTKGNNDEPANGSILLDFDTSAGSPVEGRSEQSGDNSIFVIVDDTMDAVFSTVDWEVVKNSAGSYHVWQDTDDNPANYNGGQTGQVAAKPVNAKDSAEISKPEDASGANTAQSDNTEQGKDTTQNMSLITDTEQSSDTVQGSDTEEIGDTAQSSDTEESSDTAQSSDTALDQKDDEDTAIVEDPEETSDQTADTDSEATKGADTSADQIDQADPGNGQTADNVPDQSTIADFDGSQASDTSTDLGDGDGDGDHEAPADDAQIPDIYSGQTDNDEGDNADTGSAADGSTTDGCVADGSATEESAADAPADTASADQE